MRTETPLIPRAVLWGNPDRILPRVSPDGHRIAFLAPRDGVLNVWVGPSNDPSAARPVTRETARPIGGYHWAHTSAHVLYLRDSGGDENWHVLAADLESGEVRDLTGHDGVQAQVQRISQRFPTEIVVGMNDRDPELHDLYRVDILTGERACIERNPGFLSWVVDDDYRARFGLRFLEDGNLEYTKKEGDAFEPWLTVSRENSASFHIVGIDPTGEQVYAVDPRGRDTTALVRLSIEDASVSVIAEHPNSDVWGTLIREADRQLLAVGFNRERLKWQVIDDSVKADFEELSKLDSGDADVVSQSADDRAWVVSFTHDDGPIRYHLWLRDPREARFLFSHRAELLEQPLAPMRPVIIRSRDALDLVSYLTLPLGVTAPDYDRPRQPLPMVVLVHGGPWSRDEWGYHPVHQMLANRGYAVLSVNFRGSTGFGKAFINAADHEWGRKMHEDLLDGVEWAVNSGIADPARVAIMGGSYGGYAVLVGLTMTPDVFACGVDIVGPSSLRTLIDSVPPYWRPQLQMLRDRVGDDRTEEGRRLLDARSPLNHVHRIEKPLLIAQGANDPRVKQSESDRIVAAMDAKGIPVTYALFPDEGHGFARPENNRAFFAAVEAFLAEHLGGRIEPLTGEDFTGSTMEIRAGLEGVPAIAAARS